MSFSSFIFLDYFTKRVNPTWMQRTKSSYVGKGMICNIHEGIVNEQLRSFNPYLYLEGKARTSLRYQRRVSSQFVDRRLLHGGFNGSL